MEFTTHNKHSVFIAVLLSCLTVAQAHDCFKCVSISGRFAACEDPLQHNDTLRATPCEDQRPYLGCILISGVLEDTKEVIIVRSCVTYLSLYFKNKEPDCGDVVYLKRNVTGCMTKCDSDACNSNSTISLHHRPEAGQDSLKEFLSRLANVTW